MQCAILENMQFFNAYYITVDTSERQMYLLLPVDCSVLQAECDHAAALAVLHKQVQGKVLNEVVAVIPKNISHIFYSQHLQLG